MMKSGKILSVILFVFVGLELPMAFVSAQQQKADPAAERVSIYHGDSLSIHIKGSPEPFATPVPYGTKVTGVLFDGYPQIVKQEASQPKYKVKKQKDIMVAMSDGVRIAVDVYRPDIEGEKFPAILAWGIWGKDVQEAMEWVWDKPQAYMDTPFWDGAMEAGNFSYTVPRGYAHVIPDPKGIGNSEGSGNQFGQRDIYDTQTYHIMYGRHGNDPAAGTSIGTYPPNRDYTVRAPQSLKLPDIEARL